MITKKILLTSFTTWLPHQVSNSSDDLLASLDVQNFPGMQLQFLRQLPVEVPTASQQAIATINVHQPDVVICCGMAESREYLSLESNATWKNNRLETSLDLEELINKLSYTQISYDAGKFVCEGLYYHVLKHLRLFYSQSYCLFVHIPAISTRNSRHILADFSLIIQEIAIQATIHNHNYNNPKSFALTHSSLGLCSASLMDSTKPGIEFR